ncbi:Uncharacterised protein [Roseomonas gilardii subsp. rosea]|nr:Uncharacterised protein [Roseomonas gilardii subsp. rosea]
MCGRVRIASECQPAGNYDGLTGARPSKPPEAIAKHATTGKVSEDLRGGERPPAAF